MKRLDSLNGTPILDDDTPNDVLFPREHVVTDVSRDFAIDPPEMFAPPGEMDLIPEPEYDARIEEQDRSKSSLADIRDRAANGERMPCLNQGSWKYCWAHSLTHTVMLSRAAAGQPYVPLSAFMVAAIIKRGRNEGGWCGLSAKFARDVGVCSQAFWPQLDGRLSHDTPEMRADAAKHRVEADWVDIARPVYDQNLTLQQLRSSLFRNEPCAVDFNWWGHSVAALRVRKIEDGSYGIEILNSWWLNASTMWGNYGTAILRGSKALPDGAIAVRLTTPS